MEKDQKATSGVNLDALRREINEHFPKDPLKFGHDPSLAPKVLPTGLPTLDRILEGGFQLGQITLVYGLEGSLKSTLAYVACRQAQQAGGVAALLDVERSFNPEWAEKLGVKVEDLLVTQPRTGEKAFNIINALIEAKVMVIVVDSLAAMVPTDEFYSEKGQEQKYMGDQAKMLNRGIRSTLARLTSKTTALIMINQIREGIGVMFGNPETLPGGMGQRFYAYQRIRTRRGTWIEDANKKRIGFVAKFRAEKSKAGEPFHSCEVPFYFSGKFDVNQAVFDLAFKLGIIEKKGVKYKWADREFTYEKNMKTWFKEHPEEFDRLKNQVNNTELELDEGDTDTRDSSTPEIEQVVE